jgi:hypothetical protein
MSRSELRELAHRSSAGVDVTLYWYPTLDELIVSVRDKRYCAHFETPSALPGTRRLLPPLRLRRPRRLVRKGEPACRSQFLFASEFDERNRPNVAEVTDEGG